MRVLRGIGGAVLWALAGLGVLSGIAWGAHALGLLQPLIVVSGSMSPGIRTGDLIVAVPLAIEDVAAGDVITLPSSVTQKLVTHRVVTVDHADGAFAVTMKGDANDVQDSEVYLVAAGESVSTPWFTVPAGGRIVETLSRPAVALPLLIALAALIGLAALPPEREEREELDERETAASSSSIPSGAAVKP